MPLIPHDEPLAAVAEASASRRKPPPGTPSAQSPPAPGGGSGQDPAAEPRRLQDVLTGRRSVYDFDTRPVAAGTLWQVVRLATAEHARQWPVARHGDPQLLTMVAARRVSRLQAGLHVFPGPAEPLWRDQPGWLDQLGTDHGDAPVLIFLAGSLLRAGSAGYGGLLVQTGALGYALWLAARTYGLECSVSGRADHRATHAAHGIHPGARHLFTVALGYPPPEDGGAQR